MATAEKMPPNVAMAFESLMQGDGSSFNQWLDQYVVDVVNETIENLSATDSTVSSLSSEVSGKAESGHNHTLLSLSEKSYNSLDDVPSLRVAATADDGPSDASAGVAVSAISATAGADTIALATFNTALSTLVTEINALKDIVNALVTHSNTLSAAHNDTIDNLQAANLMT